MTEAIATAKALDLSALPKGLAGDLEDGFTAADKALAALAELHEATAAVEAAAGAYRPRLVEVRAIEKQIRGVQAEIDELSTRIKRMDEGAAREKLVVRVEQLEHERAALEIAIPSDWPEINSTFTALTTAESKARSAFQRAADTAFETPAEVLEVLASEAGFETLATPLAEIGPVFATGSGKDALDRIKAVESLVGEVEGTGDVKKKLSKARRALKKDKREDALALYDEAMAEYAAQKTWRAEAEALVPGIDAYLDAIRTTLGARVQDRLTRDQALAMARCTAHHRDVSLNF